MNKTIAGIKLSHIVVVAAIVVVIALVMRNR